MIKLFSSIEALAHPSQDRLSRKSKAPFFRDALSTELSQNQLSPSEIQYAIFNYLPNWVDQLMKLRNKMVKLFGFDVGKSNMKPIKAELEVGDQAGFLTISEKYENEIISHAEDKHMSFYISVKKQDNSVIVSTLVNQKSLIGKIYVNAILPFHYFIARIVINNAAKAKRI